MAPLLRSVFIRNSVTLKVAPWASAAQREEREEKKEEEKEKGVEC